MTKSANTNVLSEALVRCRGGMFAVVLFSFIINLLMLTAPLYMLQVFDRVLTSRSTDTLIYLTVMAAFAFAALWCLDIIRGRLMIALGTWLDQRIGGEVLAANLRLSLSQRSVSVQPLRDLEQIRGFMCGPAVFPILDAPWTPVFLAAVFLLHPLLGWISLAGALVLFAIALINELATGDLLRRAGQTVTKGMDEAQAAARNADVIEAMGLSSNVVTRWVGTMAGSLGDQARASRRSGLLSATSKFIRQVLQIGILGVGAWLVLGNELSPGGMIAGSILMARALAPVEQAISSWRSGVAARAAYRRLFQVMDLAGRPPQPPPLPQPEGHLVVESVSYAHPGEKVPMLRGISFSLKAGDSLGLIGPTAVGKTTLARILIGNLKPQMGHARLDGADVATWDARDRGQYVGYLPQDIELFGGTVRQNIARLAEGDSDMVYEAARISGVHEDILGLPNGYETEIGVGGMTLSGGQRQRLGLARAIYGRPKLIVLDEPNSNLDIEGESALLQAIAVLRELETTLVIIAHRPRVLRTVDKILVLRNGTMEMMGPRDEVFARVSGEAIPGEQAQTQSRRDQDGDETRGR